MNAALWRSFALACVFALGPACGGQTLDAGTFTGAASAGRSSGSSGGKGLPAAEPDVAGGGRRAGGSAGAASVAGTSGGVPAVGQGGSGSGNGGANAGTSHGGAAADGSVSSGGRGGAGASQGGAANGGVSGESIASPSNAVAGASGDSGSGAGSAPIPATWDTVKLVLSGTRPPCSGCHGMGDGGFRITLNNDSQLFKSLTATVVKDCGNHPVVTPGDPSKSALLQIIQGDCSMKTPRMPPGCVDGDAGCVPPDYVAAVAQWISDGAPWP